LSIKNCSILYKHKNEALVEITGKNMVISSEKEPKYVRFDISIDINKENNFINLKIKDDNKVYIKNHKLFIDNKEIKLNNSKIFINANANKRNQFHIKSQSSNFNLNDIIQILKTDIIIPNSNDILAYFKNVEGNLDFTINLNNKGIDGDIKINKATLNIVPIANLPIKITNGNVKITNNNINLTNFKGKYGTTNLNNLQFAGCIKDYTKSVETDIELTGKVTNDFTQNYLSKLVGSNITLTGISDAKAIIKSKFNKIDLTTMFKIAKGDDILIEGTSLSPIAYDRAILANFHLDKNLLDIQSIKYYIAQELTKETTNVEPILTINGQIDISKLEPNKIGFKIPKPLPSEFLNVIIGQKIFKKGEIAGNMDILFINKIPKLYGALSMTNVRIPSQRLYIKDATLKTNKNSIVTSANGKFKRSDYKFQGKIKNEIIFPIIIKNINLTVDNIDIEKVLNSMTKQPTNTNQTEIEKAFTYNQEENQSDDEFVFNAGLIIVEKCDLNLIKGIYKSINFGNLIANLTLDKNGILKIKSNNFEFAEGTSSLDINCNLVNQKYQIKLGVKDINSDKLATSILNLNKEIAGKASGIVELNTDKTLKLNGKIFFDIKDGYIQKVGLIQYILNVASLFRNPITMINPSTIFDLVNIPEGKFDKINGTLVLKNNVIEKIIIKSNAPQLSAFIIGKYNIEYNDASLRIYTKFSGKHKGIAGVLRNISLNKLANTISNNSNNETNYYALELEQIPPLETGEENAQIFLTKVEGDIEHFNFLSSLKKIK